MIRIDRLTVRLPPGSERTVDAFVDHLARALAGVDLATDHRIDSLAVPPIPTSPADGPRQRAQACADAIRRAIEGGGP